MKGMTHRDATCATGCQFVDVANHAKGDTVVNSGNDGLNGFFLARH
jgi:hypothetical protein